VRTAIVEGNGWRAAIHEFIAARLHEKLENLSEEDAGKRAKLVEAHEPSNWLADAAQRISWIQLATHTLKPLHPEARGTSLHVQNPCVHPEELIGTHSVEGELTSDVVGNAAALDVYKLLSLECGGTRLLDRLAARDPDAIAALSDDPGEADRLARAFLGVLDSKGDPASHALAKQVYFPLDNGEYHVLAPLFPTSFVHTVQARIRVDRFGEAAKAARDAYRAGAPFPHGFCEYSELAIQKFGGTKPQNISQLNSERRGENWLLSSRPPVWRSTPVRAPFNVASVFGGPLTRTHTMRAAVQRLRNFLEQTPHNNIAIRETRSRMVADICDEALQYAAALRDLDPGWSADVRCELHEAEKLWLDPYRALLDEAFRVKRNRGDWSIEVSRRFANWLNATLGTERLRLGEDEARAWTNELHAELRQFEEELEYDRA
jgi:CRISPR-associated protein Csy1